MTARFATVTSHGEALYGVVTEGGFTALSPNSASSLK